MRAVSRASFLSEKTLLLRNRKRRVGEEARKSRKLFYFSEASFFSLLSESVQTLLSVRFPSIPRLLENQRAALFVLKERSDAAFFAHENVPRFVLVICFGRKTGENRSENARFSSFSLISVQKYCFSCRPERAKSLPNAAFSPFRALDALFF